MCDWRKRQDSDLRSTRSQSATRCNQPLCHASVEKGPAHVVARAKPWDWALRRRRPGFLSRWWTRRDSHPRSPACGAGATRLSVRFARQASIPHRIPVAAGCAARESRGRMSPSVGAPGSVLTWPPEPPRTTGADDGSRTRNLPVDSRLLRFRAPSATGQPGRIRTSDCSFVGCDDHPFHHGPAGRPGGVAPAMANWSGQPDSTGAPAALETG